MIYHSADERFPVDSDVDRIGARRFHRLCIPVFPAGLRASLRPRTRSHLGRLIVSLVSLLF